MDKALLHLTQALVLAAGVAVSQAIDWFPFNGKGLIIHPQYVPWAVIATLSAIACGFAWHKIRAKK